MLEHLGETKAANRLEKAVAKVIKEGKDVTYDMKPNRDDPTAVGTLEMAKAIIRAMEAGGLSRFDRNAYLRLIRGQYTRALAAACSRRAYGWRPSRYGAVVAVRNAGFDRGWKQTHRAAVPVVSVGNLTLGGTGKTPMVEWLARWYRRRGSAGRDPEPRLRPDARAERRGTGSGRKPPRRPPSSGSPIGWLWPASLTHELETELIVLDDGFQHRRLARDLDRRPARCARAVWSGASLSHAGLLREPVALAAPCRRGGLVAGRSGQCDRAAAIRAKVPNARPDGCALGRGQACATRPDRRRGDHSTRSS